MYSVKALIALMSSYNTTKNRTMKLQHVVRVCVRVCACVFRRVDTYAMHT